MIGQQDQNIGDNSNAIQAKGDVTINQGLTISQMGEIMLELQKLVGEFTQQAEQTAKKRLDDFREEVLSKFADKDQGNSDAFRDPDFQFLLKTAQINYARDGNEGTAKLLVELLAERSKLSKRDRIALILNEATDKIGRLTDEDISILSLSFILFETSGGCNSYGSFIEHIKRTVAYGIPDIKLETSSYTYLESLGCLSLNRLISRELYSIFTSSYGQLFSNGFTIDELKSKLVNPSDIDKIRGKIIPFNGEKIMSESISSGRNFNISGGSSYAVGKPQLMRFDVLNLDDLKAMLDNSGMSTADIDNVLVFNERQKWSEGAFWEHFISDVPSMQILRDNWNKIELQKVQLTSVGLAIGHANIARLYPSFKAPLSIWIK